MRVSTIAQKYPTFRDDTIKSCRKWIEGKRVDDNAEELWRVHDKLYDLTDFVDKHPGGREWLSFTKGIDITEQFETHHIRDVADKMLVKFYVRDATLPRNYKLTFDKNGFYMTLKRRVAKKLMTNTLDQSLVYRSKLYCDLTLASFIISFIVISRIYNFVSLMFCALSLLSLAISSHNFIHQKDNWRMYLINFSLQNYREWRVMHDLSHHHYPNSYHDLECSFFEPILNWMPVRKNAIQKYGSWIMSPIMYSVIFPGVFLMRAAASFTYKLKFNWDEYLPFTPIILIYTLSSHSLLTSLAIWFKVILLSSFFHGLINLNGGHHHYTNFHDNDEIKSMDFGVYQLAATYDRANLQENLFFSLITFGQHIAHHMFPALDQSVLMQVNEILYETCKDFETDLCIYPWHQLFIGQFKQLTRTNVNKVIK